MAARQLRRLTRNLVGKLLLALSQPLQWLADKIWFAGYDLVDNNFRNAMWREVNDD